MHKINAKWHWFFQSKIDSIVNAWGGSRPSNIATNKPIKTIKIKRFLAAARILISKPKNTKRRNCKTKQPTTNDGVDEGEVCGGGSRGSGDAGEAGGDADQVGDGGWIGEARCAMLALSLGDIRLYWRRDAMGLFLSEYLGSVYLVVYSPGWLNFSSSLVRLWR